MDNIPFLRPALPTVDQYLPYLREIDTSHLYSNYGPLNTRLEQELLSLLFEGRGEIVTVHNATVGLMLALAEQKTESTKVVITPSFTFAAAPQAAKWAGLTPYFVDVRPDTWSLDWDQVHQALDAVGPQNAIVMPYATFGLAPEVDRCREAVERGAKLIVDAAASLGGDRPAPGWSAVPGPAVFSMHATKAFPIGEGGLVYCADPDQAGRIRRRGNFGFGPGRAADLLGLNAKLPEMSAAVGLATLSQVEEIRDERIRLRDAYVEVMTERGLFDVGWEVQGAADAVVPQFMSVLTPAGVESESVLATLSARNIQAQHYFAPACHRHAAFSGCPTGPLPITEQLEHRIVSLPLWPTMTREIVDRVVEALRSCAS